jgi:nucleoside-diphosphate-sugar epimerase
METGHLFCFGLGFSASTLARALLLRRWSVAGTTRNGQLPARLAGLDVHVFPFDGSSAFADFESEIAKADHLLISAPPGMAGDPVLQQHHADLARFEHLKWVGYLSTTGVYGDHGGEWVDEQTPLQPINARSKRRQAAEDAWLNLWRDHNIPVHIFRLAGIYGPGRNALATLKSGRAKRVIKPGHMFSRIHVEDIALTLLQSMSHPLPGAVYNVCDNEAAPPQDVISYGAELLGMSPPPEVAFEDAEMTDMARSFYSDNKRVSNDRITQELGVRLKFPTYREGLQACLKTDGP